MEAGMEAGPGDPTQRGGNQTSYPGLQCPKSMPCPPRYPLTLPARPVSLLKFVRWAVLLPSSGLWL